MFIYIILFTTVHHLLSKEYLYSCDFQGDIEDCFTGRRIDKPHNCLIVPCSDRLNETDFCMVITKSKFGGDCFTNFIQNPTVLTDKEYYVVEFEFLAGMHPNQKSNNTGAFFGYEDGENGTDFQWVATPLFNYTFKRDSQRLLAVQIIELQFTWTQIRFFLQPKNDKFRIVLEDFIDVEDFPGDYLVNNLAVYKYQGDLCSTNCMTCEDFQNCTACQPNVNLMLWNGQCVQQQCLENKATFNKKMFTPKWVDPQNQVYGLVIKGEIDENCYQQRFFINGIELNDLIITLNFEGLKLYQCILDLESGINYICSFEFLILIKESEKIIYRITWDQYFSVNEQFEVSQGFSTQLDASDLGSQSVTITVNSTIQLCKDSGCQDVFIPEKTSIIIGQIVYIQLSIQQEFRPIYRYNLSDVQVKVMGNGTELTIVPHSLSEDSDKGQLIIKLSIPLVVQNAYLTVTAGLQAKGSLSRRRRALQSNEKRVVAQHWAIKQTFYGQLKEIFDPNKPYIVIITVCGAMIIAIGISLCVFRCRMSEKRNNKK